MRARPGEAGATVAGNADADGQIANTLAGRVRSDRKWWGLPAEMRHATGSPARTAEEATRRTDSNEMDDEEPLVARFARQGVDGLMVEEPDETEGRDMDRERRGYLIRRHHIGGPTEPEPDDA